MHNFDDGGIKRIMNRRSFLGVTGAVAVATIASGLSTPAATDRTTQAHVSGRRKLGSLEVSSIGLGVQNMSRSYETLVPYRPEMINIIRAAYDHGVTFFDTAEAYGPLECERILGESIAPFRNKVAITSKFGWNIDPETGRFQMGLNSKPDHIKKAVEGMLKRLRADRIDPLYQHRVDPQIPIWLWKFVPSPSSEPSLERKLFCEAQAWISVPSTVRCSSLIKRLACLFWPQVAPIVSLPR